MVPFSGGPVSGFAKRGTDGAVWSWGTFLRIYSEARGRGEHQLSRFLTVFQPETAPEKGDQILVVMDEGPPIVHSIVSDKRGVTTRRPIRCGSRMGLWVLIMDGVTATRFSSQAFFTYPTIDQEELLDRVPRPVWFLRSYLRLDE